MNKDSFELSQYRLKKAKGDLDTAIENLENGHFPASVNRAYYSIFHAMRAILALDGFDSKKHSGVIAYFRQNYIKTNIFDTSYSEIIGLAFEIRNKNDYDDFVVTNVDEVIRQGANAKLFLEAVEAYLENRWNLMKKEDGNESR